MGNILTRAFSAMARASEFKDDKKPDPSKIQKHLRRGFFCFLPRFLVMLLALVVMGYEIHDSFSFKDR
ncbi:hypothetical protein KEM54_004004, partial [Ascosphaera aggregata]